MWSSSVNAQKKTSTRLEGPPQELRKRFLALQSARDVAALLDVSHAHLVYLLHKVPMERRYREFRIPKRRGDSRIIRAPATTLKLVQRKLLQVLEAVYEPRLVTHGFVEARSILTNAERHVGATWVLNVDLIDFFPSIHFGRVLGLFMARPYALPADAARRLSQICCHDGQLPQGAPTSPIVSNMICRPLDGALQRLAKRHGCTYTRFADDLTFSTHAARFPRRVAALSPGSPPSAVELGADLASALAKAGFTPNVRKQRLMHRTGSQVVTGVTVNHNLNVRRTYVRQVRAMLHAWERWGYEAAEQEWRTRFDTRSRAPDTPAPRFRNVIRGKLEYLGMVRGRNDPLFVSLLQRLAVLDASLAGAIPGPVARDHRRLMEAVLVIESGDRQGSAFFLDGVGLVTCAHCIVPNTDTRVWNAGNPLDQKAVRVLRQNAEQDLAVLAVDGEFAVSHNLLRAAGQVEVGQRIETVGFAGYTKGDKIYSREGVVWTLRTRFGQRLAVVNAPILAGMSGGPALNGRGEVVGVCVTGADRQATADSTEHHGVIPVAVLDSI